MSWFDVYLFTRLDVINAVLVLACGVLFFATLFATASYFAESTPDKKKIAIIFNIVFFFVTILKCLIPTTKEAAAILILPKIASEENIEFATNESKELYRLAKQWIKESIEKDGE